jgi:hypothetical protein
LLDSGVVDVTMSYNAICTSRIILEGIVFQLYFRVNWLRLSRILR